MNGFKCSSDTVHLATFSALGQKNQCRSFSRHLLSRNAVRKVELRMKRDTADKVQALPHMQTRSSGRARRNVENQTASRTSARSGQCRGSVHGDVLPVKCTTGAKGRNQHDAAEQRIDLLVLPRTQKRAPQDLHCSTQIHANHALRLENSTVGAQIPGNANTLPRERRYLCTSCKNARSRERSMTEKLLTVRHTGWPVPYSQSRGSKPEKKGLPS